MPHSVVRRAHVFAARGDAILQAHAVNEMGEGRPPLVLLHGFGTDQTIWRDLAPSLCQDRRVVLYDQMGCGASDIAHYDPERYGTLEGYADDFVEILDALDLREATVVGHSVAGTISLLASLRTDRIAKLIMVGSSARYLNDAGYEGGFELQDVEDFLGLMELDFQGWAKTLAPRVLDEPDTSPLVDELVFSFSRANADLSRRFARATFMSDHRAQLAACALPTLVLQTRLDAVVPLTAARFLADHIPQAHLEILDARGHYPQLSAPETFLRAIQSFLSEAAG